MKWLILGAGAAAAVGDPEAGERLLSVVMLMASILIALGILTVLFMDGAIFVPVAVLYFNL